MQTWIANLPTGQGKKYETGIGKRMRNYVCLCHRKTKIYQRNFLVWPFWSAHLKQIKQYFASLKD
jgi:hypothetical protein